MIIDLERFLLDERPYWSELEAMLGVMGDDPLRRWSVDEVRRFHYLYERAASDLARLTTFSFEPETRRYLDALVGRAYAEIHETREKRLRLAPLRWFLQTFPQTFRRHSRPFKLAVAITAAGLILGGTVISLDPESREILLPYSHLRITPQERVAQEEHAATDPLHGRQATFSSFLMTHNIQVSILCLSLGMTWGVGTILLLFTNGVLIGAVAVDYLLAGQGRFLFGWLLPHGAVEIPAFLIAGQAGLVLGGAILGRHDRRRLRARLRAVGGDLVTLVFGAAALLVWAGIIEGFLSQYHAPVIPYEWKIALGVGEVALLVLFLSRSGLRGSRETGGTP